MPAQFGGYDTLRSLAGKVFTYLSTITLTGTDGKTITLTQDTSLDEAVAMSSKAPKASPVFTGSATVGSLSGIVKAAAGVLSATALGAANLKLFIDAAGTAPEWASGVKIGTFDRDLTAAAENVPITGVGFKPSVLFIFGAIDSLSPEVWSLGIADSANNYSVSFGNSGCRALSFLIVGYPAGGAYQTAIIASLDSDGYTLTFAKAGSPTGILKLFYLAIR